jgi:hypothetical protein
MSKKNEEMVMVAVKTPLMPRATTAYLSGRLTMAQSLEQLRKVPPKDATATRVLQQLARETSGPHDYLVVNRAGEVVKVDPHKTTLLEVAVPREVKTNRGVETVPTAAFEVQAYAPVGAC